MRWAILIGAALLAAGCGKSASTRAIEAADRERFEAVLAESMDLRASIDEVEARLYSARAEVGLWAELAARHGQVSEVACQNAQMHADGMDAQQRRNQERLRRNRMAHSGKVMTDVRVSGYRTPVQP